MYKPATQEQAANRLLVNKIMNSSGDSKIGLVAYAGQVSLAYSIPLTNSILDLNTTINSWISAPSSQTCICCGISNATNWLSSSNREKVMIVMSDGLATIDCSLGGTASEDAVTAACNANSTLSNLIIHSVGFNVGSIPLARETLVNISNCGGGQYYDAADAGQLADAYQAIADSVTQTFTSITQFNFLRVVFYGSTGSVVRDVEVPGILEIINYDFQLSSIDLTGPIIKIEIYPIIITDSGREITGPLLDSWEV